MKKIRFLLWVIAFIVLLYGCHSSSDNIFVQPGTDTVITSREVRIDEHGRLPTVTFPSGTTITGAEENTLQPGIIVNITEHSISSKGSAYFNNYANSTYLYSITAFQEPSNLSKSKTYVTTIEKPFTITIPNTQNSNGVCYIGIKESENEPWRYMPAEAENSILSNTASARLKTNVASKEFTFKLHRLSTYFGIAEFNNKTNVLPETLVDSMIASSSAAILVKNGKYKEDFRIRGILKGIKLDSINPMDFRARITYRNNIENNAPIKVNGVSVKQNSSKDSLIPGYTYCHTFVVDSLSGFALVNSEGQFDFTLNLSGIDKKSFPSDFLIEFYNKITGEKIQPYIFTEFYGVTPKESVNLVIKPDGGICELKPTFTIDVGRELSDSDKKKIESAISISDVPSENITKNWSGKILSISVENELEPESDYVLSIADVDDIESISIKDVEDVHFKTISLNKSFSISYNLNGGNYENGKTNSEVYGNASESFELNNPQKEGYIFTGWTGSNGNEPQVVVKIEKGTEGNKSFTANYSAVAYKITYILGDDSIENNNPAGYNRASETIILSEPIRDGYTFKGWTGSNGDIPQLNVSIEQGSTGDKEFRANFSPVSYKIAYTLNDGLVENANPESYDITSATITINNPTKDYYNFIGWTGTGLNSPTTNLSIIQGSKGDKAFVANFAPVNYSIAYNLNGGELAKVNPVEYDVTSSTINLNNPTKIGHTFKGWSGTDLTGDENLSLSIPQGSNGNRSYTANWSINSYNLTLNKGAGIESVTGAGVYEYNAEVAASCTLCAHYEFDSWTGDSIVENFAMPAANATMTANAKPIVYTIDYDLNGGSYAEGVTNPTNYDITSESITINNPARIGFVFNGWTGTDIEEGLASVTVKINQGSYGNRNYIASFSPIGYDIVYNCNGGDLPDGVSNPLRYDGNTIPFTLNNPVKNGYEFAGWTSEDITTPQMTVTIPQNSTGNKEFTAHWKLVLALTIASETGSVVYPPELNLYKTYTIFRIIPSVADGIVLTQQEKDNILAAISVKDSENNSFNYLAKTWNNEGSISLTFTEELNANATYRVSCGNIEGTVLTCEPLEFTTFYFKGGGTDANPYKIETAEQLNLVRNYLDKSFIQINDIDLASYSCWLPIGNNTNKFSCKYEGNNKKISNLKINYVSDETPYNEGYIGLFGNCYSGRIANLNLSNVSIIINNNYTYQIGSLLGEGYIPFTNCSVSSMTVVVNTHKIILGGIVGRLRGSYELNNCSVTLASFSCSSVSGISAGGIVGTIENNVQYCNAIDIDMNCSSNDVGSGNSVNLGGICGGSSKNITSCNLSSSSGKHRIYGFGSNTCPVRIGGIFGGSNLGLISSCSVKGYELIGSSGTYTYIGGIGGYANSSSGSISNSFVEDIDISASSSSNSCYTGGIGGSLDGQISLCYIKDSTITAAADNLGTCYTGGICGSAYSSNNENNPQSCYVLNTSINGLAGFTGGICGYVYKNNVSACYVYNDAAHDVTGSKVGYLVGNLYKRNGYSSNSGGMYDSFCNNNTDKLFYQVGEGDSYVYNIPAGGYDRIRNCYDGIESFTTFSSKNWSDDKAYNADDSVWKDYNISENSWPPDLKELPRGD